MRCDYTWSRRTHKLYVQEDSVLLSCSKLQTKRTQRRSTQSKFNNNNNNNNKSKQKISLISKMTEMTDLKPHPISDQSNHESSEDRFACNICFESVKSPVVTRCGHIYCWSCLYIWLEPGMTLAERQYLDSSYVEFGSGQIDETRRLCPVCKSVCSVKELVPIYVRDVSQSSYTGGGSSRDSENNCVQIDDEKNSENCHDENDLDDLDDVDDRKMPAQEESKHDGSESDEFVQVDANSASAAVSSVNENQIMGDDSTNSENTTSQSTGLRRRTPQQRQQSNIPPQAEELPSRPLPPPTRTQQINQSNRTNTHPSHRYQVGIGSGGGITTNSSALALHQSLFQALVTVQTNSNSHSLNDHENHMQSNSIHRTNIPSLHYRNSTSTNNAADNMDELHESNRRDAASEFLSRLLLMLACFVVLCLLLF